MRKLLLTTALCVLASSANAQIFNIGNEFTVTTQNSPATGGSNTVTFTPGVTQSLDAGAVDLTISIVNASDFATTGAQWALFNYTTPGFHALSSGGQNWSIEQVGIPLAEDSNFIADFTQWTSTTGPITQVSPIFSQTLMSNPVPGGSGNGEGTSGFIDPIPAGAAPQLGAFADPFQLVINGLGGNVPSGFTQALEFSPSSFVPPPSGVPEPSTWAMLGIGFALLAFVGVRKRKDRLNIAL
jgi:hypothetical protein